MSSMLTSLCRRSNAEVDSSSAKRRRDEQRHASEGWVWLARPVAEDQEPQLFAE